jgi:hypothetical protein
VEKSKYVKYERTRTPRHQRSKVAEGSFDERNRFFHCWNCGQMFDLQKISGNPETGGCYQMAVIFPSQPPGWNGDDRITQEELALSIQSTLDPFLNSFVSLETDSDGNPIPISVINVMDAETTTGVCPGCGTANLP